MKQKTKKTIELVNFLHHLINKKKLLKSNQSIVLAISGGQDSISLFFICLQLKDQWNWKLSIIYCNHLWQKDSFYTMLHIFKLAYLLNIPIYLTVTLQKIFTEQKARNWRSFTFQRITGFYLFSVIVLGHSKSDRVETGLFNLFRGSSTKGVSSLNWTKVILKGCFFKLSKIQLNQTFNKNLIKIPNKNTFFVGEGIQGILVPFVFKENKKSQIFVSSLSENIKNFNKICYRITKNPSVELSLLKPMILQIDLTHNVKDENNNINVFNSLKPKQLKNYTPLTSPFNSALIKILFLFGSQVEDFFPSKRKYITLTKILFLFGDVRHLAKIPFLLSKEYKEGPSNSDKNSIFVSIFVKDLSVLMSEAEFASLLYETGALKQSNLFLRDLSIYFMSNKNKSLTSYVLKLTLDKQEYFPDKAKANFNKSDRNLKETKRNFLFPCLDKSLIKTSFLFLIYYRFVRINQRRNTSNTSSTKIFVILAEPRKDFFFKRKSPKLVNKNSRTNIIKKFLIYKVGVDFKCKFKNSEKKKKLILQNRQKNLFRKQHHIFAMNLMETFVYTNTIRKEEKQKNNVKMKTLLTKTRPFFIFFSGKQASCIPSKNTIFVKRRNTKFLSRLYKHEYILVRPFLSLTRFDLKKICNSWKIPLFPDQSNQRLQYQRNRIRKQILPTLRFFFNPQIDTTIFQFIEIINSEQEYMDFITARIVKEIQYKKETRVELETSFLALLPIALRRKVMKQLLEKIMKKSLKFFDIEKLLQQVSIKRGLIRQEATFPIKKQQKKIKFITFDVRQSQSTIQTFKKHGFPKENNCCAKRDHGFVSSLFKKGNLEIKSIIQKDLLVNLINKKKGIYKEYTLVFFPKIGSIFLQSQRIFFIKKK